MAATDISNRILNSPYGPPEAHARSGGDFGSFVQNRGQLVRA
jgi:hypothetical protein